MTLHEYNGRWYARKSKKAKREEDVTDIIEFVAPDVVAVMGKAGRTEFHAYLGKKGNYWKQMRGVTSVLNKWGEKDKLVQWAVDRAVDYLQDPRVCEEAVPGLWYVHESQLEKARTAHKSALKDAGDWGTKVHAEVESYIKAAIENGGKLTAVREGSDSAREFMKWAIYEDVEFLASEKVVYSKELWLAGTLDFLCRMNGKLMVGDVKTSNWVSAKHFLQAGGAYPLLLDEPIDGAIIVHLPRTGGIKTWTNSEVGVSVDNLKNGYKALLELDELDDVMSSNLYV